MKNNPAMIHTKRLVLRPLEKGDAQAIFDMRSNDNVNRYIGRDAMTEIGQAEALIDKTLQATQEGTAIAFAAQRKGQDGPIIGTCGLTNIDRKNKLAEIGGELSPHLWGKHLAIEAVSAIAEYGFVHAGIHRIYAKFDSENRGVIHIMGELGFVLDEKLPGFFEMDGKKRDLWIFYLEAPLFTPFSTNS